MKCTARLQLFVSVPIRSDLFRQRRMGQQHNEGTGTYYDTIYPPADNSFSLRYDPNNC